MKYFSLDDYNSRDKYLGTKGKENTMNYKKATFWMVQKEGGGPATVQHATKAEAEKEAKRLAGLYGGTYFVLCCETVVTGTPQTTYQVSSNNLLSVTGCSPYSEEYEEIDEFLLALRNRYTF